MRLHGLGFPYTSCNIDIECIYHMSLHSLVFRCSDNKAVSCIQCTLVNILNNIPMACITILRTFHTNVSFTVTAYNVAIRASCFPATITRENLFFAPAAYSQCANRAPDTTIRAYYIIAFFAVPKSAFTTEGFITGAGDGYHS
jgi:hypothetical protein